MDENRCHNSSFLVPELMDSLKGCTRQRVFLSHQFVFVAFNKYEGWYSAEEAAQEQFFTKAESECLEAGINSKD